MIIYLTLIIVSCLVIWRASDGFEIASSYLGRHLGDGVRGATINAIGSSMPELFTTFWFLFVMHDRDGFAGGIGTTAGSAIFNGMIIPAVVILAVIGFGMAKRVDVSRRVILRDGLSLIIAEIVLIVVIKGATLTWWHGLVLMLVYLLYLFVIFKFMREPEASHVTHNEGEADPIVSEESMSTFWAIVKLDLEKLMIRSDLQKKNAWPLLIISMIIIGSACALLVHACEGMALALGIHTYFIAVVLASAATSVPDTILSYRDAMQGEYDDAVANALGSNIFDVCFALGFPLFAYTLIFGPLSMSPATVDNVTELRVILLCSTVVAFLIYVVRKGMGRLKAFLLLAIYVLFMIYIGGKAYESHWALEIGAWIRQLIT